MPRNRSHSHCPSLIGMPYQGPNAFVFEYGRHNMDEGYVQMEINFVAPYNMSTPEKGEMRLSGIVLNATHLTAYKEVSGHPVARQSLPPLSGNSRIPTDAAPWLVAGSPRASRSQW